MIIGISGKLKSGKDTVTEIIMAHRPYTKVKFANKLKQMIAVLIDCPEHLLEDQEFKETPLGNNWGNLTPRTLLQTLGTDWGRKLYENMWVAATMAGLHPDVDYIINDVRFPNEVEAIRKAGGIIVRIDRPGQSRSDHPSETALDTYHDWDFYIYNDGTLLDLEYITASLISRFNL